MTAAHIDAVSMMENSVYPFPWTRGNFIDSLVSEYPAQVLVDESDGQRVIGYFVAMDGVEEMHLLNITVAPQAEHRGHGRGMLDVVVSLCRERRATRLWLEVRQSNLRARALYRRYGFVETGVRRGYYPAPEGRREDACVMTLDVPGAVRAVV
jgi:ribosomal-protein-alanine N-acetyltransferase